MKVLLVARGSQGDVYPFLAMAQSLKEKGHEVSIHLPFAFENLAKDIDIPCTLIHDDIEAREEKINKKFLMFYILRWMGEMIESQFTELLPMVEKCDIIIATNTEFAAPTIAEYLGKPLMKTAYAPFITGDNLLPPFSNVVRPNIITTPKLMWKIFNSMTDSFALKPVNKWRAAHGMKPVKSQPNHAYGVATNLMLYSPLFGEVDPQWKYKWKIGGYCFYDAMPHDKNVLVKFLEFIHKNKKPTLFFTTGSLKGTAQIDFAKELNAICKTYGYKLVIGAGWASMGSDFQDDDIHILESLVPHSLVFEHCKAIIHHGGSGTAHSAARAGIPQLAAPFFVDQFYWGERIRVLGLGPRSVSLKKTRGGKLESIVVDLMTNERYAKNAADLGIKLRGEKAVENTVGFIEGAV